MNDKADTLEAMGTKLRELELDHVQLAGRIMELRECMALVENGPRRRPGRPRKATAGLSVINEPAWDGQAPTECDEQGPLPSLDNVRGILKENVG